jgi:hypothetical protein
MSETALVTLGFRCPAELKSSLAITAASENISLSSYVKEIVSDSEVTRKKLVNALSKSESERKLLLDKISKYENPLLKNLFEVYRGKSATLIDVNGHRKTIIVESIADLHEVILMSFKK